VFAVIEVEARPPTAVGPDLRPLRPPTLWVVGQGLHRGLRSQQELRHLDAAKLRCDVQRRVSSPRGGNGCNGGCGAL